MYNLKIISLRCDHLSLGSALSKKYVIVVYKNNGIVDSLGSYVSFKNTLYIRVNFRRLRFWTQRNLSVRNRQVLRLINFMVNFLNFFSKYAFFSESS